MSTQGNVLRCFRILDSLKSKQPSYFTDEEIVADNGGGIGQKGEEKILLAPVALLGLLSNS